MKRVPTTSVDLRIPAGRLTAMSGSHLGRSYLVEPALVIGRTSSQPRLDDNEVSRRHARAWRETDGTFHVEDLGSMNGTFVNGVRTARSPLVFGDRLRVGRTTFVFGRHDVESEVLFQRNRVDTVGHVTLGLVHDFNNALCVVKSMTALLQEDPDLTTAARDECLADMAAACERAEQLTKRMMGFARGHQVAGLVDLRDVVVETLRLVRRALPDNVQIVADVPAGLRFFGESTQVMQVLLNLVINARDAIGVGHAGQVWINGSHRNDEILLSVRDDGCGMTPEVKARLFEPFFSTKGPKGNGIGLASVKEIVHSHGGRLDVDSAPGAGTTFRVHLPTHVEATSGRPRSTAEMHAVSVSGGAGERVLVLDPNPGSQRSVTRLLRLAGYVVESAGDLHVDPSRADPIDVLVVDLDLDERGEVARFIGEHRAHRSDLAIVCMVTTPHDGMLARARALGAHAVLPKPFNRAELLAALHRALATVDTHLPADETRQDLRR